MSSSLREKILWLVSPLVRVPVTGLDISDRSIKYLQFNSFGEPKINFLGEISLPAGLITNGLIEQEKNLIKILKEWLAKDGWRLRYSGIVVSLPEEKSFIRSLQIPKIKRDEIDNVIRWEIGTNIPLPIEQLSYGYEIIDPLEDHLDHFDILVTAFPKDIIESYVRVLKTAGFSLMAMEHESQAVVRALMADPREKSAKVIIDMGRNRTSFIIFAGGSINFTATIELGGRILEESLIREMKINPEQAFQMKKEVGLNRGEYEGRVFSALAPAIAVLADELKKVITFYQGRPPHLHGASLEIKEVLLTGGDSSLLGLDTYLASSLKIPVNMGNPLASLYKSYSSVSLKMFPLPQNQLPAFSIVIGLAMRKDFL